MSQHTAHCFANHLGVWACEPRWLSGAVAAVKAGTLKPRASMDDEMSATRPVVWGMVVAAEPITDSRRRVIYGLTADGIAIIQIDGALMKAESKYGGTSTVELRKSIRAALADDRVAGIMLHFDSPGGHVAGTQELADEVTAARATKPVAAHIDDTGASAAYWIASCAQKITANAMGEVGSIGVYGVMVDESKAAEMAGVVVHVISSGGLKGAGYPGTVVTAAQLEYEQGLVDAMNGHFVKAVKKNRGMSDAQIKAVTDGRVFPAAEAKALGLIDAVMPFERALADFTKESSKASRRASKRDQMQATIDIARAE